MDIFLLPLISVLFKKRERKQKNLGLVALSSCKPMMQYHTTPDKMEYSDWKPDWLGNSSLHNNQATNDSTVYLSSVLCDVALICAVRNLVASGVYR